MIISNAIIKGRIDKDNSLNSTHIRLEPNDIIEASDFFKCVIECEIVESSILIDCKVKYKPLSGGYPIPKIVGAVFKECEIESGFVKCIKKTKEEYESLISEFDMFDWYSVQRIFYAKFGDK